MSSIDKLKKKEKQCMGNNEKVPFFLFGYNYNYKLQTDFVIVRSEQHTCMHGMIRSMANLLKARI